MADLTNPFHHLPLFRETRDGRHIVAINIYPKLSMRALSLLRCSPSVESVQNAILQWRAEDLENAAAEAGLPIAMVRTFEEFQKEPQYTEVLSHMPLITVEKIGDSEPIAFKKDAKSPLDAPWAGSARPAFSRPCVGGRSQEAASRHCFSDENPCCG
jgi:hypothetical protein